MNLDIADFLLTKEKISAVFRILVVFIAFIDILVLLPDLNLLLSKEAILPLQLGIIKTEYYFYLNPLYHFIENIGLSLNEFVFAVCSIYIIFLILCGLGVLTRFSFFMAIIAQLILFRSFPNFNYGYDHFLTMSFFYCLVFPVSREFSIDVIFQKDKGKRKTWKVDLFMFLRTHLCIVYAFSGIAKALDVNWWNGNAIWRAIADLGTFPYIPPVILLFASVFTVLSELSYPILVNTRFRKIAVINIILMHIGIAVFMGLTSFAAILIIWNLIAFHNIFIPRPHVQ